MQALVPPNSKALSDAFSLSEELLTDIELSRLPLANIALKGSRLARLLNDFDYQKILQYETSGYPTTPGGFAPDVWSLLEKAGRHFQKEDVKSKHVGTYSYKDSIEQLESIVRTTALAFEAARDPNVSLSSSNPSQYLHVPPGNQGERLRLQNILSNSTSRLASRRAFIYEYVLGKHYELKFSGIASDVFASVREKVDSSVGVLAPTAIQKFSPVHENLRSENPEDWSNAVHSCRRILQDLADAIFPPCDEPRKVDVGGQIKSIKLGVDNYINRIVCFVQDKSGSGRFEDLVGSHVRFLGDRLDAVFSAAQKGSHATVGRDEANRYVVYTYMIVGDILSLS